MQSLLLFPESTNIVASWLRPQCCEQRVVFSQRLHAFQTGLLPLQAILSILMSQQSNCKEKPVNITISSYAQRLYVHCSNLLKHSCPCSLTGLLIPWVTSWVIKHAGQWALRHRIFHSRMSRAERFLRHANHKPHWCVQYPWGRFIGNRLCGKHIVLPNNCSGRSMKCRACLIMICHARGARRYVKKKNATPLSKKCTCKRFNSFQH